MGCPSGNSVKPHAFLGQTVLSGIMAGIREYRRHEKPHWNLADLVALSSFSPPLFLLIALQQMLWLTGTHQLSCYPTQDREIVKKLQRELGNKYSSIWSTTALTWQLLLSKLLFILLAMNIKEVEASWKLKAAERDFAQLERSPWQTQSQGNQRAMVAQKSVWNMSCTDSPSNPIALVLQHPHFYYCRKGIRVPLCPFGELNQLPEHICLSKKLKLCHLPLLLRLHHIQNMRPFCLFSTMIMWLLWHEAGGESQSMGRRARRLNCIYFHNSSWTETH